MAVKIHIRYYGVRDAQGRFARVSEAIKEGLMEEMESVGRRMVEQYRQSIEESGIKSDTGRLISGIHIEKITPLSVTVSPSADRLKVAEGLDQGVVDHLVPARRRKGYVHVHARARGFVDDAIGKLNEDLPDFVDVMVGRKVKRVFGD